MVVINVKQFCKKTGFPLAMIRTLCREGKLSHWKRGRVYLLNEDTAVKELDEMKDLTVYKKRQKVLPRPKTVHRSCIGPFDYGAEIARLKHECKRAVVPNDNKTKKEA